MSVSFLAAEIGVNRNMIPPPIAKLPHEFLPGIRRDRHSTKLPNQKANFSAARGIDGWGEISLEIQGKRVKAGAVDEEETVHTAPALECSFSFA